MKRGNQLGTPNTFHLYSIICKDEDRRKQISSDQLSLFPFNTMGTISSIKNIQKREQAPLIKISMGFLISGCLVLTSCDNFVSQGFNNKKIEEYLPLYFTILQFDQKAQKRIISKSIKIKDIKINRNFVQIFKKIASLKERQQNQKDVSLKLKYLTEIIKLESDAIRHNFTLLKLQNTIERPYYFKLLPDLNENTLLTVAGYQHSDNQFPFFTHSNVCNSISNEAIFYDIDAHKSGAPVYISGDEQHRQLVGIHNGYLPQKDQNCATMITKSVIVTLKEWAKEMKTYFKVMGLAPSTIENANKLIIRYATPIFLFVFSNIYILTLLSLIK